MRNVLLQKYVMGGYRLIERCLENLQIGGLIYNYNSSTWNAQDPIGFNSGFTNTIVSKSYTTELVSFIYENIKFNMIPCPSGKIEFKVHNLTHTENVKSFMLGETEVTQELFEAVMGFNYSEHRGIDYPNSEKLPVDNVSSWDCLSFCNKLSEHFGLEPFYKLTNVVIGQIDYSTKKPNKQVKSIRTASVKTNNNANGFRLACTSEWLIAAFAGTHNQFPGAKDEGFLPKTAWFNENSGQKSHPVGQKSHPVGQKPHPVAQKLPNEIGLYDMCGNIDEFIHPYKPEGIGSDRTFHVEYHDVGEIGGDYMSTLIHLNNLSQSSSFGWPSGKTGFRIAI
jgi:formylglycine-generating enzyme required for sulfatase activity